MACDARIFTYGMGGIENCKRLRNKTTIHNTHFPMFFLSLLDTVHATMIGFLDVTASTVVDTVHDILIDFQM